MLWDFKLALAERLRLLKAILVNSYNLDTAYFFETWGNAASTITFTITYVLLIEVVFANVKVLAGYDKNQVLLLAFLAQMNYYVLSGWSTDNMKEFITQVNQGDLDMILSKPVPALFYITVQRIYLMDTLRDGVVPLLLVGWLINWPALGLKAGSILVAAVLFILGQLAIHVIHFLVAIPVIWLGQSEQLYNIVYALNSSDVVPYEGLSTKLRIFLVILLPILVPTSLTASVLLGKTAWLPALLVTMAVTTVFMGIKIGVWRLALRSYTSASS